MNKWLGTGKITENPVIHYADDKEPFATFTVMSVRPGPIPKGGQAVDFIDCRATGRVFPFVRDHVTKGKKFEITGPLQSGSYTDREGRKVYTKTVLVQSINFAETKAEEEARRQAEENRPPKQEEIPPPIPEDEDLLDPDAGVNEAELPFR